MPTGGEELVKITDIAKETPYAAEYLSLRARQGKLKSQKIGNIWYTTREAINEYRATQDARKNVSSLVSRLLTSSSPLQTHQSIDRQPIPRTPWLIRWIAIPLSLVILFGFIPVQFLYKSVLVSMAVLNDLADESKSSFTQSIKREDNVQAPAVVSNFATYSRMMLVAAARPTGTFFVKFYQNHPTILAASRSNFRDLEKQINQKYGSTSETSISLLRSIATGSVENLSPLMVKTQPAQVAGLKSEIKAVPGYSGLVTMSAGQQSIHLRFNRPVRQISIVPLDSPDFHHSINRLDSQTFEVKLSKITIAPMQFYWSADY